MRAFFVLIAVSVLAFAAWYIQRPAGPVEEPQSMAAAEDTSTAVAEEAPEIVTLSTNADEIAGIYENAPWVHRGLDGPVLYAITFRTCTSCLAFKEAELAGLEEAGVDVRWIVYARRDREDRQRSTPAERAVQAELWLNRDWDLFKDWYAVDPDTYYATSELPPSADDDPARAAAVEEARALVDGLADLYEEAGTDLYIPALLWQQDGEWRTYVGYEETSFAPARAYLTGQD